MTKILVIEDEAAIRANIVELLEAEDFEVLQAKNGQIGINIAKAEIPDLIICDVMMPELDGYGVIKALRKEPNTATIPFIFLTALADKSENRKGMEMGADDYLTKPCMPDDLLKAISIRLEKQEIIHKKSQQKLDELRSSIALSLPHELRTPLNGILGFTNILMSEYESLEISEIREMLGYIHASGERLYRLIQNFLLYAEVELIANDPERLKALRSYEINNILNCITEISIPRAIQAHREKDLHLDIQDGINIKISAHRLQKIIEEILDNAFKFSQPNTPINITSNIKDNYYILRITDKGRGMTPEQIAAIGAYRQFERKLYEQQGSGLGLMLSKRLTELHNGKFMIESTPKQQTIVEIWIPKA